MQNSKNKLPWKFNLLIQVPYFAVPCAVLCLLVCKARCCLSLFNFIITTNSQSEVKANSGEPNLMCLLCTISQPYYSGIMSVQYALRILNVFSESCGVRKDGAALFSITPRWTFFGFDRVTLNFCIFLDRVTL